MHGAIHRQAVQQRTPGSPTVPGTPGRRFAIPANEIGDTRVLPTLLDGQVVRDARQPMFSTRYLSADQSVALIMKTFGGSSGTKYFARSSVHSGSAAKSAQTCSRCARSR